MSVDYLDPTTVLAVERTKTPRCPSRDGYGSKLPTSYLVMLSDRRWRRIYVICFSNSGSAYVRVGGKCLYLGSWEPSDNTANAA